MLNTSDSLFELLNFLCSQPSETQWLEFKLNKGSISNEEIGEYISSLSNGATLSNKPCGYLVWGVNDNTRQPVGTNFTFLGAKQGNQDLELWLRNLLSPSINIEIKEFNHQNKHFVILVIPAANGQPTHFKHKSYIRIGSNKTILGNYPDLIRSIYNSTEDWSARTIPSATINDLEPNAIKIAREKFKENNQNSSYYREVDNWDDLTFLDKAKINVNGKITNTSIILLGKPESSHYLLPSIAEITWKLDTEEKAYQHFGPPFILNTTEVLHRIRNVNYKFFPDNELLATTVSKYDSRSILEALYNCIAHQDYSLNSRIIVTEKIDSLIFSNAGSFFEGIPEEYSAGNKTPQRYRNQWLANAMHNLSMIDRLGYGIFTLYKAQKERFFPLPDYDTTDKYKVLLHLYGHSINENYTKLLIERKDLPLSTVVLLDRVQKNLPIPDNAIALLKKEGLIEGRKPHFFISSSIASITNDIASYTKNKAFDTLYYKDLIIKYLGKKKQASRKDIDSLLMDKLSDILSPEKKRMKIKNILTSMSTMDKTIQNISNSKANPEWVLTNTKK